MGRKIEVVFDGPPDHKAGRFVDVHDTNGQSIRVGEWIEHDDGSGFWGLRLEIVATPCTHRFMTDHGRVTCDMREGHHGDHYATAHFSYKARQGETHDY